MTWFGNPGWRGSPNRAALDGAAGAPWTPASLTNLVAWYKADVGVTTSSGHVTQVLDQSGHNYTLTPFTGTSAGTVPFSATGFNGLPAFTFTAANDSGLATGVSNASWEVSLPSTTALSVFFVGQMLTATTSFGRAIDIADGLLQDFAATGNIPSIVRNATSNSISLFYNSVNVMNTAISLATNYRLGIVIAGGTATHYVNNVSGSSAATTIALTTPTHIGIGNQMESGGAGMGSAAWEGAIGEIVIAASDITTNLTNLDNYFRARWGL